MNQRTLQLPGEFFPALHRALRAERSAAEAASLLRQVGYATGAAVQAALERWLSEQERGPAVSLSTDEFWAALNEFFHASGWGSLVHIRLHPGVAALDSPDWIEAGSPNVATSSGCHVAEGVLADLLGRVAGSPVAVMEVECRSRGDQQCRHLFGSETALGAVHRGMVAGRSYSEAISRLEA